MPITIITPANGVLTPGAQIFGNTSLIGPIPNDWEWWFTLQDATHEETQLQQRIQSHGSREFTLQWLDPRVQIIMANSPRNMDGQPGRLLVQLMTPTAVQEESASTAIQYDGVTGLPTIQQIASQSGTGLTPAQSQQLDEVHQATALSALTDALLLTELTTGPQSDQLVKLLTTVTFGVIVRLTTIPAELVPQTPDGGYWVKTLATVRLYRQNDLWIRAPIHTRTKIVPFESESLVVWVANLTLSTWLLGMNLVVDFLPGVFGQVYQMHFP